MELIGQMPIHLILLGLGIGGRAGYVAAIFHLLGHSVTKSLLFLGLFPDALISLIDAGFGMLL